MLSVAMGTTTLEEGPLMADKFCLRVEKRSKGRVFGILEGKLDGPAAWRVIKWLEGLGQYPDKVVLHCKGISSMDWLGVRVLLDGVQTLSRRRGSRIWLRHFRIQRVERAK